MPDAYDGLSARLIETAGFKAVQCSGYSMALASLASREESLGLARNLEITRHIVQTVGIPVMADGEDGFGPPSSVHATVSSFLDAGVAGINIEDQVLPPGETRTVVEPQLMVEKIRAAREAAKQMNAADLVINGRTDVLAASEDRVRGVAEAIDRGNQYLEAGADLIFITSVATLRKHGVSSRESKVQSASQRAYPTISRAFRATHCASAVSPASVCQRLLSRRR